MPVRVPGNGEAARQRSGSMDLSWIVFAAGCAASFPPIYWALSRLIYGPKVRDIAEPRARAEGDGTEQFLDCLRQEVIARLEAALAEAVRSRTTAGSDGGAGGASADRQAMSHLVELRRALAPLLPNKAPAGIDRVVAALDARSPSGVELAAAIAELRAQLSEDTGERRRTDPLLDAPQSLQVAARPPSDATREAGAGPLSRTPQHAWKEAA
jgi:hypothetical protein